MTQVTWFARLVTSEGAPAAGVGVQLQVYDLTDGWKGIGDATTGTDGRVRATADAPGAAPGPAPMLRLMETDRSPAILGGVPVVSATGSPPALACDFGEIVHIPDRVTMMRVAPLRMNLRAAEVAGIAAPAAAARGGVAEALGGASARNEAAELQTRLATREADFGKLQVERDAVAGQLSARATEAQKAAAERDEARTLLAGRNVDLQKSQAEHAAIRADLETRATAIRAVQAERDDARTQLATRVVDLQNSQAETATARQQLTSNATALRALQAERDDARNQLATRETDVERVRLERDTIKTQLIESEKRLSEIRTGAIAAAATAARDTPATANFGTFVTRLGGDIDSAQLALRNRGFSLGTVQIRTPVLVDKDQQVTVPDQEQVRNVPKEALSEIQFGYHPTPEGDAAGTGVTVPDIRQLTESAARRVLVSVGLGLEVTQGPPSLDPSCVDGQVMLQSPKAGETAPRGTRVIAIFSRAGG